MHAMSPAIDVNCREEYALPVHLHERSRAIDRASRGASYSAAREGIKQNSDRLSVLSQCDNKVCANYSCTITNGIRLRGVFTRAERGTLPTGQLKSSRQADNCSVGA